MWLTNRRIVKLEEEVTRLQKELESLRLGQTLKPYSYYSSYAFREGPGFPLKTVVKLLLDYNQLVLQSLPATDATPYLTPADTNKCEPPAPQTPQS
jgi:hypothetical protein